MGVARLSSLRSKDPNTQVGACIVNTEQKIVGIGYNGMPVGCCDEDLPWNRTGPFLDTKYPYICHAEMNAIMNKNSSNLKDCTMYVDFFPCNECAKLIIQARIKRVVYMRDKYRDQPAFIASRNLLTMAKVDIVQFTPKRKSITISFDLEEDQQPLESIANSSKNANV
jgi:dCMP deaminase